MSHTSTNPPGLTVVELIITIALTSVILIFVYVLFDAFYRSNINIAKNSIQTANLKVALHQIRSDLSKNNGLLANLEVEDSVLGPGESTTEWQWSNETIIASTPATVDGPTNPARKLVMDNTTPDECSGSAPTFLTVKYIYFVEAGSLYRRTILPDINHSCDTIASFDQKQTCAAQDRASHVDICQASDAVLLHDVSKFEINYYITEGGSTPIEIDEDNAQTSVENAKAATVILETTDRINGKDNIETASIRLNIARKNS